MADKKTSGLKSGWELAMARLDKKEGPPAALSDGQKKALAEIDSQAKAKLAEIDILMTRKLAEARAKGDAEALKNLEEQKMTDIQRIRRHAEDDKERIRKGQ